MFGCYTPVTTNDQWDNRLQPPALNDPTCYIGVGSLPEATSGGNAILCQGPYYRIVASQNEDIYVDLQGATITQPLNVIGGRNIIIVNGTIDIQTAPGCAAGDLDFSNNDSTPSAHPRIPTGGALRWSNYQVAWIEGMCIMVNGHEADAMISSTGDGFVQSQADAFERREDYIINTRVQGMEGVIAGLHGDVYQNQFRAIKSLYFENVTGLAAYNGMIHQGNGGPNNLLLDARNYYYDFDPVYSNDGTFDDPTQGPAIFTDAEVQNYENICYRNANGSWQGAFDQFNGVQYHDPSLNISSGSAVPNSAFTQIAGDVTTSANNPPPVADCDFAPKSMLGANYVSPFDHPYCR